MDIILQFPKSAIYFFRFTRKWVNKAVYRHIIAMVLAMILLRGNRTLGNMSRLYLHSRHRSSMSRCLNYSVFPGFIIHQHLYNRLLAEALDIPGARGIAYIIIDTTAKKKRSGKMENRIIYKKGYTSCHFFVMGMLYFPDTGARIPLPRRLYRTKNYCRKHGYKYRTQIQLAENMIRYANLPDDVEVIVIFDTLFSSESFIKLLRQKGYHFVCSVKDNRVDLDTGKQLKVIIEQHISEGQLNTRVDVRVTSKRSRYNHPSAHRYETKKYVTYTEKLSISKMGDVQIVFSRKADDEKSLMKYIATDMLSLTTHQILTIYSYRWQIELFFKELKSYLGLGDYQVLSFRAIVRHVDMVIMAFMYLEHLRLCKLRENPKDKHWLYAHTLQMSYVLQHEVRMTNLGFIKRAIKNEGNLDKLEREFLEKAPLVA